MKFINDTLYIEFEDLASQGISENTIFSATYRGDFETIRDPEDARRVLIAFDSLGTRYKDMIEKMLAGRKPVEYMQEENLYRMARPASDDIVYVERVTGLERAKTIARSAALLKLYTSTTTPAQLKALNMGLKTRDDLAFAIVRIGNRHNLDGLALDLNSPNLLKMFARRVRNFIASQPPVMSLVSGKYGNKNAGKMTEEIACFIADLYAKPQKLGYETIARLVNEYCEATGLERISRATIWNHINAGDFRATLTASRHSASDFHNDYVPAIRREKPKYHGALWMIDGSPIELYYSEGNRLRRMYGVLVVDAHDWRIMGIALGDSETTALVKTAVKRACIDSGMLPWQLQYDNGSALKGKEQQEWLAMIAKYNTPTAVGNARAKTIEPMLRQYTEALRFYDNWAGHGVKSNRDNSPNQDHLKLNFKNLPNRAGVCKQIMDSVAQWNQSRPIQVPDDKRRSFTIDTQIMLFWEYRTKGEERETYTYTRDGVKLTHKGDTRFYVVKGEQATWDVNFHLDNVGNSFHVKYNPDDLSQICLLHNDRPIGVASEIPSVPMALVDRDEETNDGGRTYDLQQAQKQISKEAKRRRLEQAQNSVIDTEGIIKAPFASGGHMKDDLNLAEDDLKSRYAGMYMPNDDDCKPVNDY